LRKEALIIKVYSSHHEWRLRDRPQSELRDVFVDGLAGAVHTLFTRYAGEKGVFVVLHIKLVKGRKIIQTNTNIIKVGWHLL
jgi:hypothetical protein